MTYNYQNSLRKSTNKIIIKFWNVKAKIKQLIY